MAGYVDERGDRVPTSDSNHTVRLTGVEARQGLLGRPVLMVLIAGLILAAVAWAGAEMFGEATDNDAVTQTQQVAPAEDQAAPANQGTVDNAPSNGEQMQTAPVDKDPTPQTGTGG